MLEEIADPDAPRNSCGLQLLKPEGGELSQQIFAKASQTCLRDEDASLTECRVDAAEVRVPIIMSRLRHESECSHVGPESRQWFFSNPAFFRFQTFSPLQLTSHVPPICATICQLGARCFLPRQI